MTRFYYVKVDMEEAREIGVLRLCHNHLVDIRQVEKMRGVEYLSNHVIAGTKEEAERLLLIKKVMSE